MRIGTLVKISGQVVRTHPVHPELVTFPHFDLHVCAAVTRSCLRGVHDVSAVFRSAGPSSAWTARR